MRVGSLISNSFLNARFKVALHGLEGMQSHSPDDAREHASVTVFLCYYSAVEAPTGGYIFANVCSQFKPEKMCPHGERKKTGRCHNIMSLALGRQPHFRPLSICDACLHVEGSVKPFFLYILHH